jgi:hypothetical protein
MRFLSGALVGMAIAAVDNFAFGGEVSPIVIVLLLATATCVFGAIWSRRGWISTLGTWICLPLIHLVKYVFGLPDTLHPNTFTSIAMLGMFSLAVACIGQLSGTLARGLIHRAIPHNQSK